MYLFIQPLHYRQDAAQGHLKRTIAGFHSEFSFSKIQVDKSRLKKKKKKKKKNF